MDPLVIIAIVGLLVTVIGAALGVAYQTGRLSVRVEKLEEWRAEIRAELGEIKAGVYRLENLITGEER